MRSAISHAQVWFSAWERKDLNLEVQLSDDELLEKVWPMVLAMSGRSVSSASLSTPSTHRRGYCFHFGCMYVCMYVSALERKRLIGMT